VNKPWQHLGIPFAITPISQLHQSPPSPIPGDLGRGPSHQSHVLEHRDTYGQAQVCLRVEFLLKTDSGYPRDAEVTLFTLANPEHSLCFNTYWSAPPVSALARSGGPRKMSQSPVSRNSNIERRMDRPRAVVGVIRGVA